MPSSRESWQRHSVTVIFVEIQRRAVAHINAEKAVSVKHNNTYPRQTKVKEGSRSRSLMVNEATTEKKTNSRHVRYPNKKNASKAKAREDFLFRPKCRMSYKELLGIPGVVEKMKFP